MWICGFWSAVGKGNWSSSMLAYLCQWKKAIRTQWEQYQEGFTKNWQPTLGFYSWYCGHIPDQKQFERGRVYVVIIWGVTTQHGGRGMAARLQVSRVSILDSSALHVMTSWQSRKRGRQKVRLGYKTPRLLSDPLPLQWGSTSLGVYNHLKQLWP